MPEDRFFDWNENLRTYDADGNRTDTDDPRVIRRDEEADMHLRKYYETGDEFFLDKNLETMGKPLSDFK